MTFQTEAYFDLFFGIDAVDEIPVPDHAASSDNGASIRNLSLGGWRREVIL
jgi:hypothetical protein